MIILYRSTQKGGRYIDGQNQGIRRTEGIRRSHAVVLGKRVRSDVSERFDGENGASTIQLLRDVWRQEVVVYDRAPKIFGNQDRLFEGQTSRPCVGARIHQIVFQRHHRYCLSNESVLRMFLRQYHCGTRTSRFSILPDNEPLSRAVANSCSAGA